MYYLPQIKPKSTTFFEIFSSGRSLEGHLTVNSEERKNCNNNKFDSLHCFFIFRTQCVTISEEKTFKPQRQENVENENNE